MSANPRPATEGVGEAAGLAHGRGPRVGGERACGAQDPAPFELPSGHVCLGT